MTEDITNRSEPDRMVRPLKQNAVGAEGCVLGRGHFLAPRFPVMKVLGVNHVGLDGSGAGCLAKWIAPFFAASFFLFFVIYSYFRFCCCFTLVFFLLPGAFVILMGENRTAISGGGGM